MRGRCLSTAPDVLVVGGGPTGLTMALQAHAHGAEVRVVERRPQAFRPSRAMIMHPRTLEALRPLGITEALLERGDRSPTAELHLGSRRVRVQLGEVALGDTSFPHLTLLRQMDVEEVLAEALAERGVEVERGVELVDASTAVDAAHATLRGHGGDEEVTCGFVVGCDGQDSTLRRTAAIGWPGGAYREEVVLADLELDSPLSPGVLHIAAAHPGLVFLFALGEAATWRLLATRPGLESNAPFGQPGAAVPAAELQEILDEAGLGAVLAEARWSARVRLQHRLAASFRQGRLFLAGDAAHTHSPAAAQGMNTGILDAVNLGWKLAFAARGDVPAGLLDSYERERRAVARQVLALTHLVFFAEASTHPLPALFREAVLPLLAPVIPPLVQQPRLMAQVVRLLSQGWVSYRRSPISVRGTPVGRAPHPGDRLPDQDVTVDGRTLRVHALTARPGVHVLLDRDAEPLDEPFLGPDVTVHRISSWSGRQLHVARPDGHVGYTCGTADADQLRAWLDLVGAAPGRGTQGGAGARPTSGW